MDEQDLAVGFSPSIEGRQKKQFKFYLQIVQCLEGFCKQMI